MPPCYDIYSLSAERNKRNIEKFLSHFCDRAKIENREGQDILITGHKKYGIEETTIPVTSLSEVIDYGISHPNHGFVFYISDHLLTKKIKGIILKFTYDGKIIFGVYIEVHEPLLLGWRRNQIRLARRLEKEIGRLTNAVKTNILVEYAPADDEEEFVSDSAFAKIYF